MAILVNNCSQITLVFKQRFNGLGLFPSKTEKYRNFNVAVRAFNELGSIILGASHNLANDDLCAPKKLCIAGAHTDHQTPVNPAELDHYGGREEIKNNLLCRSRLHPS